jgi:uncharacterized protein YggE
MKKFLALFIFLLGVAAIIKFVPVSIKQPDTITVTGEAKTDTTPQIARFSASVGVFNEDKTTAVNEVNTKMDSLVKAVKEFGIAAKDIQTQQVSVNEVNDQQRLLIYPPIPGKKGWQATNSITLILRQINQVSALTDLLQASGATNVSGPSFSVDDTSQLQVQLLSGAITDAKTKAEQAALAGGRRLGKMLTVTEGYRSAPGPLYAVADKAGGAPVEPGSERFTQTVTVTFELK